MSARIFAVVVLAVFPLGGFAFLVSFRVGRTYATWGNHILAFLLRRAPKWLGRLAIGTLVYAIVHLVVLAATRTQGATLGTRVPLAASASVAWFYLIFVAVFTVALRDPKILGAKIRRAEQASTARPNN